MNPSFHYNSYVVKAFRLIISQSVTVPLLRYLLLSYDHCFLLYNTLGILLGEQSILSKQGSTFLENQLSEQAEISEQGGMFFENC